MAEEVLTLFYKDREEVLKIYNTGGNIVQYLGGVNKRLCPLLGASIKTVKKLGKGSWGTVFEVYFNDGRTRHYAVKVVTNTKILHKSVSLQTVQQFADELSEEYNIDADIVVQFNGGNSSKMTKSVILPFWATNCSRDKKVYSKTNCKGKVTVPKGSYICPNNAYVEYMISLLVSSKLTQGISINFLDTFGFMTCSDLKQYMFMEKIDCPLSKLRSCIGHGTKLDSILNSITIQLLHAISVYQKLKIVHNDLSVDNVFLEKVTDKTVFNKQTLIDADYFSYKVGRKIIYIPKCPVIVKIGDWGLAAKYSSPYIIPADVIDESACFKTDVEKTHGLLPNYYTDFYDPLMILADILKHFSGEKLPLIRSIFETMVGMKHKTAIDKYWISDSYYRPRAVVLDEVSKVGVRSILTDSMLMEQYLTKPPKGSKIVLLGSS